MTDRLTRQSASASATAPTSVDAAITMLRHALLNEAALDVNPAGSAEDFAELAVAASKLTQYCNALANGDLRAELDLSGPMASALKGLQANLRHLTWQARQIAEGDLTQRVRFLGEFSDAFNHMIDRLSETLDELRENESELRWASLAAEHSALSMAIFDETGRYVQANRQAAEMTGYSVEEMLGMHVWDLMPEYSPQRFAEMLEQHADEDELQLDSIMLRKNGDLIAVTVVLSRVPLDEGVAIVSFTMDVTDRQLAESAMRESEQKFANAFEGNPLSMAVIDEDWCYLDVNRSWEVYGGFLRDELTGRDARATGILATADRLSRAITEYQRLGHLDGFELGCTAKPGTALVGLLSAQPMMIGGRRCMLAEFEDVTERRRVEAENGEWTERLETLTEQTIATMARLVEARDPYTAGHEQRVTKLSVAIARLMKLDKERMAGLEVAAELHDIGKMSVPSEILSKPGKLSTAEFNIVRGHAAAGGEILSSIDFPWPVADIVVQHHERQDGSGYPAGLSGDEILLESRILAVADVVEAMWAHRPYRPSLGIDAALEEIEGGRGTRFDADVVDACLRLFREKNFKLK